MSISTFFVIMNSLPTIISRTDNGCKLTGRQSSAERPTDAKQQQAYIRHSLQYAYSQKKHQNYSLHKGIQGGFVTNSANSVHFSADNAKNRLI